MSRTVQYAHTPVSFGVHIREAGEDGHVSEFQLVHPRGTLALWFAMKGPEGWSRTITVTAPERFLSVPCRTAKEFQQVVDRWLAAADTAADNEEAGR